MICPITLDLVVDVLVKFPQLLYTVADTVFEKLEAFGFLMPLTVYLKQRLVVSLYDVDLQVVPLGTFWMVGSSTAVVRAGDSQPYHVAADQTNT